MITKYDVYTVYSDQKHYPWCLGSVQKQSFRYVCQPELERESFAEKLLVVFAFGTACLLACFPAFVVF